VTAQLIDSSNGAHLWAERYDRQLEDVFAIQDDIVRSIVPVLPAHVSRAETQRALTRPPATLQAYDYFLHASAAYASFHHSFAIDKIYEARSFLTRCLQSDPHFARAHVLMSTTKTTTYAIYGLGNKDYFNPDALGAAHNSANTAVELMPSLPEAHAQLGYTYTFMRQHDLAVREFEHAFDLNSNFTDWRFCPTLMWAGMAERGIESAKRHMRFDPFALPIAQGYLGFALLTAKRYEEAAQHLREFVARSPGHPGGRTWLIASYAHMGRIDDARKEASELLRIRPNFSIESGPGRNPFRRSEDHQHFLEGLRRVGLPE
jgi:adenylate cyclase